MKNTTNSQQMFTPEVVTFGETMALMMPTGTKGIEYSAQFGKSFGGAETNVAIGISRLGHRVGWFGRLGDDPFGRMIRKSLRGEGVDVSKVELSKDEPTGLMLREAVAGKSSVYYYRNHSAASAMLPQHIDAEYISQAKILHVTGITAALSLNCRESLIESMRIAREAGVKVCFDPNLRLKLWSIEEARPVLLELAEHADYFLPGLDELHLLYDTEDFVQIINKLKKLNAISIVKGGDNETYIVEDDKVTSVPYFKVERIIDTVGAGDGFCAGFIAAILKDYNHTEAVRLGNLIGSLVIQFEGDWEALPTWEEIEAILHNKKHIER